MENSYIDKIKDGIVEISKETLTYKNRFNISKEDLPVDLLRIYVDTEIDNLLRINNAKNILPKPNSVLALIDFKKGLVNNDINLSYLTDETIDRLSVKLSNTINRFKFEYSKISDELTKAKELVLGSNEIDIIFDLEIIPDIRLYKDIIESTNIDLIIGDLDFEEYDILKRELESAIGVTAFTTNFQELDKSVLPEVVIKVREVLEEIDKNTLEEIIITLSELIDNPKSALQIMSNSNGFKHYLKVAGNLMFYLLYKITLHADDEVNKIVKKYMRNLTLAIGSIITENTHHNYVIIDVRREFDPLENNLIFKITTNNNIIKDLGVTKPVIIGYIIKSLGILKTDFNLIDGGAYSLKLYKNLITENKDVYIEKYKEMLNNMVEVYRLKKANTLKLTLIKSSEKIVNEIKKEYALNIDAYVVANDVKSYLDKMNLIKLVTKTNEVIDEIVDIILNRIDPAAAYFKQILENVSDKKPNLKKAIFVYLIKYLVNQLQPLQ